MLHLNRSTHVQINSHAFSLLSSGLGIYSWNYRSWEIPTVPQMQLHSSSLQPQEQRMEPHLPPLLPKGMLPSGCAALTSPLPWQPEGFVLFVLVLPILEHTDPHSTGV